MKKVRGLVVVVLLLGCVSLAQGKTRFHFVYGAQCTSYMDWQSFYFEQSFKAIGQEGRLTRLLACDDPELVFTDELELVSETYVHPIVARHEYSQDVYTAYNRPYGFFRWFEDNPPDEDEVIVIIDPDMLLVRTLTDEDIPDIEMLKGAPILQEYTYLEERGFRNGLQKYSVNMPIARPVGVPQLWHRDDLEEVNAWWHVQTEAIRENTKDRELTLDGGWTSEMYGLVYAATDLGIEPVVRRKLMSYPMYGYVANAPFLMHWGIFMEFQGLSFDKHNYLVEETSPLSCKNNKFPDWGTVPEWTYPRVEDPTDNACYAARGKALAHIFLNFIEHTAASFRERRGCPVVSRFPRVEPLPYHPDMLREIDERIGCSTDWHPNVREYPPLPAPATRDARRQATLEGYAKSRTPHAPENLDVGANVRFVFNAECERNGEWRTAIIDGSYTGAFAAAGLPRPQITRVYACDPYRPQEERPDTAYASVETLEVVTRSAHHLLGKWEPAYNVPWGLARLMQPDTTTVSQEILVIADENTTFVRGWDVPAYVREVFARDPRHAADVDRAPSAAWLLRGSPIASACRPGTRVRATQVLGTISAFTDRPDLVEDACLPIIVHRDDLLELTRLWLRFTSAARIEKARGDLGSTAEFNAIGMSVALSRMGLSWGAVVTDAVFDPSVSYNARPPPPLLDRASVTPLMVDPRLPAHHLSCAHPWPPPSWPVAWPLALPRDAPCPAARSAVATHLSDVFAVAAVARLRRCTTAPASPDDVWVARAKTLYAAAAAPVFWELVDKALGCPAAGLSRAAEAADDSAWATLADLVAALPQPAPVDAASPQAVPTPLRTDQAGAGGGAAVVAGKGCASWWYMLVGGVIALAGERAWRIGWRVYEKRQLRSRYKLP